MRCLQIVAMVAVLAGTSTAWADNLPPVPKTIPVTVSAVIRERIEPAPAPKVEQPSSAAMDAPLPPVSGKVETSCDSKTCCHRPIEKAVGFLNELLRKSIYDVQKALNELEGRRLCREGRCLAAEAERLAVKQATLECRKADQQQQAKKLKAKHAELYGE
jgi:hypothetical protein